MSGSHGPENRWYDHDQHLSVAINLTLKMPMEILEVICKGVSLLAEKEFKAKETLKNFKSLGSDKVLSMYRSKEKKRFYDSNPTIHKMMNYLCLMSPENQQFMAQHILSIMELVQDYLALCQQTNTEPNPKDVENLTYTYVHVGNDEAKRILQTITKEFLQRVENHAHKLDKSSNIEEEYSDRQNMRVTRRKK